MYFIISRLEANKWGTKFQCWGANKGWSDIEADNAHPYETVEKAEAALARIEKRGDYFSHGAMISTVIES